MKIKKRFKKKRSKAKLMMFGVRGNKLTTRLKSMIIGDKVIKNPDVFDTLLNKKGEAGKLHISIVNASRRLKDGNIPSNLVLPKGKHSNRIKARFEQKAFQLKADRKKLETLGFQLAV